MPVTQTILRNRFPFFLILAALGVAGCGTTCIQGFFNPGGGVRVTSPSTSCPVPTVMGAMNAVALTMPACENCSAATRVEHLFVTVRSIQLRAGPTIGADSPEWVELAPPLADEPKQIDLISASRSEVLVEKAAVPAGNYDQLRVRFSSASGGTAESPDTAEEPLTKDACGVTRSNCIVTADGRVQLLRFPGAASELVIPLGAAQSHALLVLPDSTIDVRLRLHPQLTVASTTEGLKVQYLLTGKAEAVRSSTE
jgi:Domain of unknown function (DUF4382)